MEINVDNFMYEHNGEVLKGFKALVFCAVLETAKQGKPSVDVNGCCIYKESNGDCCIVGKVLEQENPQQFEVEIVQDTTCIGADVMELISEGKIKLVSQRYDTDNLNAFLSRLQICHDEPAERVNSRLPADLTREQLWHELFLKEVEKLATQYSRFCVTHPDVDYFIMVRDALNEVLEEAKKLAV